MAIAYRHSMKRDIQAAIPLRKGGDDSFDFGRVVDWKRHAVTTQLIAIQPL